MTVMMAAADGKDSEERGRAIVQTLAVVVESMVHSADQLPLSYYHHKSKFEAFRAPGISIREYLMRIHKYAACSPECFVLALVYIDRLHQMQGIVLTELNVHRVLITSIVLAAKFFDDHYFNNTYYAKVGGVPCVEMNELEIEFLLLINFSLHVATDTYMHYYNELANHYIFTSVRNATLSYRQQLRHYVMEDPEQDGQLVYVTEVATPPPTATRHSRIEGSDVKSSLSSSTTATSAAGSNSNSAGIVCTTRTAGQKRRSAVALGVNA